MQICLQQVIFTRCVDAQRERINGENHLFYIILQSGWIHDAC